MKLIDYKIVQQCIGLNDFDGECRMLLVVGGCNSNNAHTWCSGGVRSLSTHQSDHEHALHVRR